MAKKALKIFVTNDPFYAENGYVISLRDGGPCWIIDPGMDPEPEEMVSHIREHKLVPEKIVLTHGHADHIAGIDQVLEALGPLPVYMAKEEWDALSDPMANLSGLFGPGLVTGVRDPIDLPAGGTISLDGVSWKILNTGGHSPGGRSLYSSEHGIVFSGDALFAGSVGRVDFPTSHGPDLIRNIREQLMSLPDETRVFSGHGPETTIGRERRGNPFIVSSSFDVGD